MEFVGYISNNMLDIADIIYHCNENCVINEDEHFKLAIKMPQCNMVEICALYVWNEFANISNEDRDRAIRSKAEETIRFFQETTAVINDYIPRLIYNDVMTILRQNNGTIGAYQHNQDTDTLLRDNDVSLECDSRRGVWFVNVRNIVTFSLDNENSAQRVYQLVSKDILNYICFRWYRP